MILGGGGCSSGGLVVCLFFCYGRIGDMVGKWQHFVHDVSIIINK